MVSQTNQKIKMGHSYTKQSLMTFLAVLVSIATARSQSSAVDMQVERFLDQQRSDWHDMNVPFEDGKVLYDLIIKNNYQNALEIGTSTGHSSIWMAWALSKTGGKLITIEIDEGRHRQALKNFEEAGVSDYIDARLADAHQLVKTLEGPFDFVFSDADKGWYTQYFIDIDPKLKVGGCFTAHNVRNGYWGVEDFLEHIGNRTDYTTTISSSSGSGISISYKKN